MKFKESDVAIQSRYFDRDVSWLSFNERVLMEAEKRDIPLLERLKFLAIYSSNLDEFYRVRIPVVMAMNKFDSSTNELLDQIREIIADHQNRYGQALTDSILPALKKNGIHFLYNETIPRPLAKYVEDIFYTKIAGLIHVVNLARDQEFFPENNKIYLAVTLHGSDEIFVVNIPSGNVPRFQTISTSGKTYVLMLDDIVRQNLSRLFDISEIRGAYSFKVTRDAELNLKDDVSGTLTGKLEKLLAKRDYGLATRMLYDTEMPPEVLDKVVRILKLKHATKVAGGRYHNLRDFFSFPLADRKFCYPEQPAVAPGIAESESIYSFIDRQDFMLHTPYHRYDLILRFFNESAIDPYVEKIYVTLYRVAVDSAIGHALMAAARNGKRVTVLVELKARFDEANNIRWAKKMKAAGVKICYSSSSMKVHAKIALVKRPRGNEKACYYGLFSTGNFNENTANIYTDHILLTSHRPMLQEALKLFRILVKKGPKSLADRDAKFTNLIVAPFTILERFFSLIDREIAHASQGRRAAITIKLNNLEETTLIEKLYEASSAGVRINLIVRSICRLIPGVKGLSENIQVKRIVDRYLEHGRVFVFYNDGKEEVYCGSADWMNRNVYHRIEVCFPIFDDGIRKDLLNIIHLQCSDTAQAVSIDQELSNVPLTPSRSKKIRSQEAIFSMVSGQQD